MIKDGQLEKIYDAIKTLNCKNDDEMIAEFIICWISSQNQFSDIDSIWLGAYEYCKRISNG